MRIAAFLLSLALIFTIPWEDAINIGGFGTLARIIGVSLVLIWICSALRTGFRKLHPFHWMLFLFVLWNAASFYWSLEVDGTVEHIKTYVQLAIMAWVLWDLYTTTSDVIAAMEAYVLGAYVAIGGTIYDFATEHTISNYEIGRYAGASMNAVDLAIILILGLPVAWHLATSYGVKNRFLRLLNLAYIPVSLFAIILTGSRTIIFAVAPSIFYIFGTSNQLKPFIRILAFSIFFVCLITLIHYYVPASTVSRLASAGDSIAERDLGGRVEQWRKSIAVFSAHPVLGIGSGALNTTIGGGAHSTFLSIMSELGLIGLGLFVITLAIVIYQILNQQRIFSWLWLTVLASWSIGAFTLNWAYRKPTWLFLTLIIISANIVRGHNNIIKT